MVLGPASIQRLYRCEKQQAQFIVNTAYPEEHWYSSLIKEGDCIVKPIDAPQGFHQQFMFQKFFCLMNLENKMTSAIKDIVLMIKSI